MNGDRRPEDPEKDSDVTMGQEKKAARRANSEAMISLLRQVKDSITETAGRTDISIEEQAQRLDIIRDEGRASISRTEAMMDELRGRMDGWETRSADTDKDSEPEKFRQVAATNRIRITNAELGNGETDQTQKQIPRDN